MARRRRWVGLGFLAVALLVLVDQWSKAEVFARIGPPGRGNAQADLTVDVHGHSRLLLLGTWLSFQLSCNPGAAFGQFDQFPVLLLVGRCLAVVFLAALVLRSDADRRLVFVAIVLVLAGALGNVIDNLWTGCEPRALDEGWIRPRAVRDFIDVWFQPLVGWDYHFPSFNVADSCITVGAVLWVLSGFLPRPRPRATEPVQ